MSGLDVAGEIRWSILAGMTRTGLEGAREDIADCEDTVRRLVAANEHRAALTELMEAYGDSLYRYCTALVRDQSLAEDILQMTFLDAFRALPKFEGRSTFKIWLLGIARHRCLDAGRRRTRWKRLLGKSDPREVSGTAVPLTADAFSDPELGPPLEDCLGRLSPSGRDGVLLRFRRSLSYEEMAALSGEAAGTLRVRVFRALDFLRRCLEQKGVSLA
jgi:RNA polymerase sigma-70 factor (ECF subfamily)